MLSPERNAVAMRRVRLNSRRPMLALALRGEPFTALRHDTGEIMPTRDELAERVGAGPGDVSRAMAERARFGAVIVRRERIAGVRGPGRAVYPMDPLVATGPTGGARDRAQAGAPPPRLVEGDDGRGPRGPSPREPGRPGLSAPAAGR